MGNLHEMFAYSVCNGVKIVKNKQNKNKPYKSPWYWRIYCTRKIKTNKIGIVKC